MKFSNKLIKFSKSDIKKELILPERPSEKLAEELGWHTGDGSMNFYRKKGLYQLRGHLIDDKEHYLSKIIQAYKEIYNLNLKIREMPSSGVIGFQVWSDALVSFKHKILGMPLGKKGSIKIPGFIVNNKDLFFAFVRGLFDTDGCFYTENKNGKRYPKLEIKTTSRRLCLQVHKYLEKYGIKNTSHRYKRPQKNWADLYTISLRGIDSLEKWMGSIRTNNPKNKKKNCLVATKWIHGSAEI